MSGVSTKMHSVYIILFLSSVIAVVMETRRIKVMDPCSLSLLFPWGNGRVGGEWYGLTRQAKDSYGSRKEVFFCLYYITFFIFILLL